MIFEMKSESTKSQAVIGPNLELAKMLKTVFSGLMCSHRLFIVGALSKYD